MAGETKDQTSKERLVSDLRSLVSDAEELLKATASQAGETIAVAQQKLEQSLTEGKQALEQISPVLEGAPNDDFQDLVERCLNQVEHAHERMIRDQNEIERLKLETRVMIARLLAA